MSNTKAVHRRFWQSMGERFGKRWLDDFGDEPSRAWTDLIDRYTPEDIAGALSLLSTRHERNRSHPPTHDEFEALLARAVNTKRHDPTDYTRGFWRSLVISAVMTEARIISEAWRSISYEAFEAIVIREQGTLGHSVCALIDNLAEAERRNGQRTLGLYETLTRRAREIALTYATMQAKES